MKARLVLHDYYDGPDGPARCGAAVVAEIGFAPQVGTRVRMKVPKDGWSSDEDKPVPVEMAGAGSWRDYLVSDVMVVFERVVRSYVASTIIHLTVRPGKQ